MAKSRRNRARAKGVDPIARRARTPKPPQDPELAALREERILPVLRDLKSPEPKSRTAAAKAITNIISNERCRKLLLREQVVHVVLSQTLTDSSLESKASGWEILQVLAEEEESDFCVHLFRSDVLSAVEFAANRILQAVGASQPPLAKAEQRYLWDMAGSIVALLVCLAEAHEEISDSIANNEAISRFLVSLVPLTAARPEELRELLDKTLWCLTTFSDDNRSLARRVTDGEISNCYSTLLGLSSASGYTAVLACALLHSVFASLEWHDQSPGKDGASDVVLIKSLVSKLIRKPPITHRPDIDPDVLTEMTLALDVLASIGTGLQGALAKKSREEREEDWNGFEDDKMSEAGADDEGDIEGREPSDDEMQEGGGGNDEADQADIDTDAMLVTGTDEPPDVALDIGDLPTLKGLIQWAVPSLVYMAAHREPRSDGHVAVQSGALSALNNLAWTLSCLDFADGGNSGILAAWAPEARKIWSSTITSVLAADTADPKLAALVTSLSWAVSRVLGGNTPLEEGQHKKFLSLYKASSELHDEGDDPFQSIGTKCIGVLGQLARHPATTSLNREVGAFLLSVLSRLPQTPAADAVEALNQLFDIYGDETLPCDQEVFWNDGFLEHLEDILPKAKAMVRSIDKRGAEELRLRADEAVVNLDRFIQYKRKHKP